MATQDIPARQVTTCDCCGISTDGIGGRWTKRARLWVRHAALDVRKIDMCDDCETVVKEAIDNAAKSLRRN